MLPSCLYTTVPFLISTLPLSAGSVLPGAIIVMLSGSIENNRLLPSVLSGSVSLASTSITTSEPCSIVTASELAIGLWFVLSAVVKKVLAQALLLVLFLERTYQT